jgi:hypothetical protein
MTTLTAAELAQSVRFDRIPRNEPFTLFAVMRNEIYLLPAFFEHYRSLGVRQFVIVDDDSDDGTGEYLAAQPDCCSGVSVHRYGARITISDARYRGLSGRAGPILKRVVPEHFLAGQYLLCADADEFLLLPDALPRLPNVIACLESHGWKSVAASLIDFYPAALTDLSDPGSPGTAAELFRRYGYFDATAFMALEPGQQPRRVAPTASERLFRTCGIRQVPPTLEFLPRWLSGLLSFPAPNAAWFKTPIVKLDCETWLDGAHEANVPPPFELMLAMAHFKFNGDTFHKIQSALTLRSHARGGKKYEHYEDMLDIMQRRGLGFLGVPSQLYSSATQLCAAGLMIVPETLPSQHPRKAVR